MLHDNWSEHSTLQEHHVFSGPNRTNSEENGLKIYLCRDHHVYGPEAIHNNARIRHEVQRIPDIYQSGAVWIMNKATRTAIRKLKDSDGNYLLNRDVSARWGYTLLGKDVYCSDAMPKMAAKATAVYYGDFSGLAVKVAEDANIEVLREKYATQHAVGVVAWMEIDTKVEDSQKIAKLTMASA